MKRALLAFVFACSLALPAYAAIGTPTTLGTANTATSSATSVTVTTTAAITSGNLVVVAVLNYSVSGATVTSVSDGTNSYTQWNTGQAFGIYSFWYKNNATAVGSGASLIVHINGALGSNSYLAAYAVQVSGASTEDTGSQATNNDSSANPPVTSGSFAVANEIVFGFLAGGDTSNGNTYTEDTGWTTLYQAISATKVNPNIYLYPVLSYLVVASTSSVTWAPNFNAPPSSGTQLIIGGWEASGAPPPSKNCTLTLMGAGPC